MKLFLCNSKKTLFALATVFFVTFIGSIVLAFYGIPLIINQTIEKSTRLEEDTEQYDRFKKLPFPIIFKLYIFSIENPDDVILGAKPELKENGPYAYKQYLRRDLITTDLGSDTLTYQEVSNFEFSAEYSDGNSEEDVLTILHPIVNGVLQTELNFLEVSGIKHSMSTLFPYSKGMDNSLFTKQKVKDIAFRGFEFADKAKCGTDIVCQGAANKIWDQTDILKNVETRDNVHYFSYLQYKNGVRVGQFSNRTMFTVKRGIDDIDDLGKIIEWNFSTDMGLYQGVNATDNDQCNRLRGTDANIYPPNLNSVTKLEVFNTDLCRIVELEYQGTKEYQHVEGYRFESTANTFKTKKTIPEEDCYCIQQTLDYDGQPNCYMDGVFDMYPCTGSNIIGSLPYFLWADPKYLEKVVMPSAADPEKHKLLLLVEPNTGTPLQGAKRIQLNMILRPNENFDFSKNLTRAVLPLIWAEELVNLPEDYVQKLKDMYFEKVKLATILKWVFISLTGVLTLVFVILFIRKIVRKKYYE